MTLILSVDPAGVTMASWSLLLLGLGGLGAMLRARGAQPIPVAVRTNRL